MSYYTYHERDYAFWQDMLTQRTSMSLTQVELARFLGISRVSVQGWEAGSSYPKAEHLKLFIALGVKLQAFAAGGEEEEIRALWKAAHQKVLLDEPWLSSMLEELPPPLTLVAPQPTEGSGANALPVTRSAPRRRVDWDDALAVASFYGRKLEMTTLKQWVVQEQGIRRFLVESVDYEAIRPALEAIQTASLEDRDSKSPGGKTSSSVLRTAAAKQSSSVAPNLANIPVGPPRRSCRTSRSQILFPV